jgi:hypothetical protein
VSRLESAAVATPRQAPGAVLRDVAPTAHAYAEHLLAGGVARWPEFLAGVGADPGAGPAPQQEPPGATQAELLRRLNRRAAPAGVPRALGERVLRRAAPGRGRVDLRLTDPPQPVPVPELLRVAAGVLADLVAELPPQDPPDPVEPPPAHRRAPAYRLEGPPVTVSALRRRLVAAGLPPRGGRRWRLRRRPDLVIVVALPIRRALFEVWSRRVQRGGTKSWPGLLADWRAGRRLPPAAAYDRLAAEWAIRIGASRVQVVTAADLDGQVAAALGRPAAAAGPAGPGSAALTPVAVEVVRRASEVLMFRVPPEEKPQRLGALVALLADPSARSSRSAPGTPPGHGGWLRSSGRRTAARLAAGGYVVHGSLSSLGRTGPPSRPTRARDRAVLAAMLGAVLRMDDLRSRTGGGRGTGE